jgi:membrane associated rhomboid family serine protease
MLLLFYFLFLIVLQFVISSFLLPLPITDTGTVRYRTLPYMTFLLILANSLIFMLWQAPNLYQGSSAFSEGDTFAASSMLTDYVQQVYQYGIRATYLRDGLSIGAATTITSMFMHGDMWHLIGNMIMLWAFGRRVEDACGSWRFLIFYLIAGMIANLGTVLLNTGADRPGIGASGAIAGVMGAYLLLFPGAWITCLWGLGSIIRYPIIIVMKLFGIGGEATRNAPMWRWTVRLPAWIFLFYFLVQELIPSFEVISGQQELQGVNNLAHLTGFLGALAIILFVRKDLVMRFFSGRSV